MFKTALSTVNLYKEISIQKPEEESSKILSEYMQVADRYILFMSLMVSMNQEGSKLSVTDVASSIAYLALKVLGRRVAKELQTCKLSSQKDLIQLSSLILNPAKLTIKPCKITLPQVVNAHMKVIAQREMPGQLKNLKISFPELLNTSELVDPIYKFK